jgi:glycosyltransferase involved in cell wall biosynthesis
MPPHVDWLATIHHGMRSGIEFGRGGRDLLFLGRISPEKRPDRAIEIAIRAGVNLTIAAKVDDVDRAYFRSEIEPMLSHPLVRFIGEVDDARKGALLGESLALLFPIDWPEPFGLVMIEAMAAGTPVIAWRNGSVPEVIRDGRGGVIVETMDEAVAAVSRVRDIDRLTVRREYDERFTSSRMADDYIRAYERLLERVPLANAPSVSQEVLASRHAASQGPLASRMDEVRP